MTHLKKALGIDIGGTKICYGIVDRNGNVLSDIKKTPTPKTSAEIYDTLKNIIQENYSNIDVVGLSSAGAVNLDNTRVVSSTPNLPHGYNNIDFSTLCDKKVYVENDANCAVVAEAAIGAGKGYHTVLMATIGTGIGGGVYSDGKLFRGAQGNALEVGSLKIFADKRQKCTCGRYDCWESYASGTGLKNCAQKGALEYEEFKTSIYKDNNPEDITTYDITDGVAKKDAFSVRVFEQWLYYMFIGLVSLTDIFNPDCIVISGGMCKFIDVQKMEDNINKESVVTDVKVKIAQTENRAGMIGAAILALVHT